jgi:hypothetical protein
MLMANFQFSLGKKASAFYGHKIFCPCINFHSKVLNQLFKVHIEIANNRLGRKRLFYEKRTNLPREIVKYFTRLIQFFVHAIE